MFHDLASAVLRPNDQGIPLSTDSHYPNILKNCSPLISKKVKAHVIILIGSTVLYINGHRQRKIDYLQTEKNKVEINGEATQVKWLIWIDLFGYWLCRIIPLLYLLWVTPKLAIALTIFKWLKNR